MLFWSCKIVVIDYLKSEKVKFSGGRFEISDLIKIRFGRKMPKI